MRMFRRVWPLVLVMVATGSAHAQSKPNIGLVLMDAEQVFAAPEQMRLDLW